MTIADHQRKKAKATTNIKTVHNGRRRHQQQWYRGGGGLSSMIGGRMMMINKMGGGSTSTSSLAGGRDGSRVSSPNNGGHVRFNRHRFLPSLSRRSSRGRGGPIRRLQQQQQGNRNPDNNNALVPQQRRGGGGGGGESTHNDDGGGGDEQNEVLLKLSSKTATTIQQIVMNLMKEGEHKLLHIVMDLKSNEVCLSAYADQQFVSSNSRGIHRIMMRLLNKEVNTMKRRYEWVNAFETLQSMPDIIDKRISTWEQVQTFLEQVVKFPSGGSDDNNNGNNGTDEGMMMTTSILTDGDNNDDGLAVTTTTTSPSSAAVVIHDDDDDDDDEEDQDGGGTSSIKTKYAKELDTQLSTLALSSPLSSSALSSSMKNHKKNRSSPSSTTTTTTPNSLWRQVAEPDLVSNLDTVDDETLQRRITLKELDLKFNARLDTIEKKDQALRESLVVKELEDRQKAKEAKERAASLMRELTDEELEMVQNAVYQSSYDSNIDPEMVVAQHGSDFVQHQSMITLRPGQWVGDEIIHFFYLMLSLRDEEMCRVNPSRLRSHFFKSFFMTKLLNEGHPTKHGQYEYKNVKRWSKKVPGKDIFGLEKILFPINMGNAHWISACIFMTQKMIQIYDSMGGPGHVYLDALFQYLKDEHKSKKGEELPDQDQWRLLPTQGDTPRQRNGFDCGVFTCMFADFVSKDCPVVFDQNHITQCRNRIALSILKGKAIM